MDAYITGPGATGAEVRGGFSELCDQETITFHVNSAYPSILECR